MLGAKGVCLRPVAGFPGCRDPAGQQRLDLGDARGGAARTGLQLGFGDLLALAPAASSTVMMSYSAPSPSTRQPPVWIR